MTSECWSGEIGAGKENAEPGTGQGYLERRAPCRLRGLGAGHKTGEHRVESGPPIAGSGRVRRVA